MTLNVRYIKLCEMCKLLGKTAPIVRKMWKEGDLPAPRKSGGTFLGWLESDFEEWVKKKDDSKK